MTSRTEDPIDILIAIKAVLRQGLPRRLALNAIVDAVLTETQRQAVYLARECSADERTDEQIAKTYHRVERIVADSEFRAPEIQWDSVNEITCVILRQPEILAAIGALNWSAMSDTNNLENRDNE